MITNEKAVIGCIMIDDESIFNVYDQLKPEMFTDEFCSKAYTELLSCYDRGIKITTEEIKTRLVWGGIKDEEVFQRLAECLTSVNTSAEIDAHSKQIIADYQVREVKKMYADASLKPADIENTISMMLNRLEELQRGEGKKALTLREIVEQERDNYFTDVDKKIIKTGFEQIDNTIRLESGEMIVVGARPAVGKSAFVTQIITNVAEQGYKVGYFNLEMSYKQVYERILARFSQIGMTRIRNAKSFLGSERLDFENANERMNMDNLVITSGSRKISEIRAESRHMGYDLIVIDYLQLVRPDRTFGNRASEVGDISKSIKALAMELNVPIIALSQMNRVNDEEHEPNIADLRESGDIEQDASIIALMWKVKDNLKGFKVGKNRQGNLMKIGLMFDGDMMEFEEHDIKDINAPQKTTVKESELPWQ